MSKKKKVTIIIVSLISTIILSAIIAFAIIILIELPPATHKPPKYPFNDTKFILKKRYLFQKTSKGTIEFKYDEMIVNIKKISKEEYLKSNLINVFADFHFDVYYRLDVKIKQDNKTYDAIAFKNIDRSTFTRDLYVFDFQIENQVYQNVFHLRNTRNGVIYGA